MTTVLGLGLSAIALLASSVALAEEEAEGVNYDISMRCSSLYTFLAGSVEGEPEEEGLLDTAARWLVLAMDRDGTEDGSKAESELEEMVDRLMAHLDIMGDDEDEIEGFLTEGVDFCAAQQETVQDEFDAVDFSEE